MQIIAIGHYKRVGKDSFADFLIHQCYLRNPKLRIGKRPWAWKLKQICHELYAWAGLREPEFYETPTGAELREVVLPEIGKSPRDIWITFGTDAVRQNVYDRTWLDYNLKTDHQLDVMIVQDTRFLNEVEAVAEIPKSHKLKIVRPGFGPGKNLPDRQLLGYRGWDNVIGETGRIEDLRWWAVCYANWICENGPEPTRTPEKMVEVLKVEVIEPWEGDEPLAELAEAEQTCCCGMLMDDHHQGSSCTTPTSMADWSRQLIRRNGVTLPPLNTVFLDTAGKVAA